MPAMDEQTGVAIIGCGNIAGSYARDLASYPETDLVGVTDLDAEKAKAMAGQFGCNVYSDLDELLADPRVEIVVNLTIHHAHYELTKKSLAAGKHVHSEKPLALTLEEAEDLVDTADRNGVRLGCSPFTYMGEAQQTAWKLIRDGFTGPVRLVYAEVNHGRLETWHPNPDPFYDVGPWFDVGVYPLTLLTTMFGPVKKVHAYGRVLCPDRTTEEGRVFHIATPDCMIVVAELADGPVARLSVNFYVCSTRQRGLEFHGDDGTVHLGCFQEFNTTVAKARPGEEFEDVPLLREPYAGIEWGRGVQDMAAAVRGNRPHRATGKQAAHVVEVLTGAARSARTGQPVQIESDFVRPAPMGWAKCR